MKRYRITFEKTQNGQRIGDAWSQIITSSREPVKGESARFLTNPPTDKTIIKVEEITQ